MILGFLASPMSIVLVLVASAWPKAIVAAEFELGGFLQGHLAARLGDVDCPSETACDFPYQESRLRLKGEAFPSSRQFEFIGDLNLIADGATDEVDFDTRELYGDYFTDDATARAGRQIITWGVGDLLFINDTFPKDWEAFFGGQPLEYLKLGSDAVRISMFPDAADIELVVADFRSDNLPDSERFVFPNRQGNGGFEKIDDPSSPVELSIKGSRYFGSWQAAVYGSRTHFRSPAELSDDSGSIRGGYPRLNTIGASLSGPFQGGVLNAEAGYFDSVEDRDGDNPGIENSETRLLLGYSRQIAQETTLGVQAYAEIMHDYHAFKRSLSDGQPADDRIRTLATLRLSRNFWNQTLRFNIFAFLGLSDDESYIIPSIRYDFNDSVWVELGANLFAGSERTEFGALDDNDNLYLTVRYAF